MMNLLLLNPKDRAIYSFLISIGLHLIIISIFIIRLVPKTESFNPKITFLGPVLRSILPESTSEIKEMPTYESLTESFILKSTGHELEPITQIKINKPVEKKFLYFRKTSIKSTFDLPEKEELSTSTNQLDEPIESFPYSPLQIQTKP